MSRKSKAQIAREAAAARKRASRQAKREAGLVRVHLQVEIPTVELLREVADRMGVTLSQVVIDLATPHLEQGLPDLQWTLPDFRSEDLDLDLPEQVADLLSSEPFLSTGSALEHLVVDRLDYLHEEDRELTYLHPVEPSSGPIYVSHGPKWTPRDPNEHRLSKYDLRRMAVELNSRPRISSSYDAHADLGATVEPPILPLDDHFLDLVERRRERHFESL